MASSKYLESGQAEGLVATVVDVTEQVRAEEKLRQSTQRLEIIHEIDQSILAAQSPAALAQAILDQIRQLIPCQRASVVVFDPDYRVGTVLASQTQGITRVGNGAHVPLEAFVTLADIRQGRIGIVEDLLALSEPSAVLQTLASEGLRSVVNIPLIAEGVLIGTLNLAADKPNAFTPEKAELTREVADTLAVAIQQARLREEVARRAMELERQVAEHTAQLQAANKELETFTYSVSHDLKAPLRGIDGYSRLLLEEYADRLDDEGRAFLHTIRRATMQMSRLIDDLLMYSRLERRSLIISHVNPHDLAEAVVAERADEIRQRGIRVTIDVPGTLIATEAEGLAQALRNLLDNAFKFTHDVPHGTIEIAGRETETSLLLWVHDNGPGFDMKYHERIFEIFQRLYRAEEYPGTGIGLAIVRKAMQRLGGRVWAESAPGQGATFYLEVPK